MPTFRQKAERILSMQMFRLILLSFVRVYWRPKLINKANMPRKGPCFIYGNHANRWDPFILNCFTPQFNTTGGVMTREFFRSRFLRWALLAVDIFPTRKRIAEPHLIRTIYEMMNRKRMFVIYPEGGTRWDGRPRPWIPSTAKLFTRLGVPIYPVIMRGSYATWPRWADHPRPGRVSVEVLPPVTFERRTPLEEALAILQAPFDFDESVTPEELRPRWAYRPADGIHRLLYRDPVTGAHGGLFTPDGTYVQNADASFRMKVLPDSRLLDEKTGEIHMANALYDQVRALPLEKDADGALLRNRVEMHTETEFPNLIPHGMVEAAFYGDAIRIKGPTEERTIPMEQLIGLDIERNYKLQLALKDEMIQLSFGEGSSALQWEDVVTPHLEAVTP